MYADKVLINRRNINTDVSRKVDGCKKFFMLEVDARITAAFCKVLDIKNTDDEPAENRMLVKLPSMSIREKREYLETVSAEVVDRFIVRKEQHEHIVKRQVYEDWLLATNVKNDAGHFICRGEGCTKTFRFDGKKRLEHEKAHGLHKAVSNPSNQIQDDMFSYQCSLLDIGMVIKNFFDAVSEGDGLRVVRSWKYMLQYLRHDGASSRKYALEALYLLFQIYAILPERAAHDLIWNRFNKSKLGQGGNIPLDLALEHYNNLLKSVIRNLGPNATNTAVIDRYCKALTVNKCLLENFDRSCKIIKRSGRHVKANISCDLRRIVAELLKNDAFEQTTGRKYECFRDLNGSLLHDFDVHAMFKWIQEHKDYVRLHKAGR